MNYKPLPDTLTIKKSNIQGFIRTPMGGFINHSETPICEKLEHEEVGVMWLKASRDIKEGEELTIKYTLYNL